VERVAEDKAEGASKPGEERSEIDIAEGEMIAAGDVIEFVAEIAVAAGEEHLEQKGEGADGPGETGFGGVDLFVEGRLVEHLWFRGENITTGAAE